MSPSKEHNLELHYILCTIKQEDSTYRKRFRVLIQSSKGLVVYSSQKWKHIFSRKFTNMEASNKIKEL
jgi:hypothetical protein